MRVKQSPVVPGKNVEKGFCRETLQEVGVCPHPIVPNTKADISESCAVPAAEGGDGVDISEQMLLEKYPEVLHALLKDHTRSKHEIEKAKEEKREPGQDQWNIIWATDNYSSHGTGFGEQDPIIEARITGEHRTLVMPRALKHKDVQKQRSKDMAEVFTPSWVCNAQNNLVDEAWFGRPGIFNTESVDENGVHTWTATPGKIVFPEEPSRTAKKSWWNYVRDLRLEITCGEAPYLVSRYDSVTGNPIEDLNQRVGLLDRKLRVVGENTETSKNWLDWAQKAVQSIYGFEWQGDNLLLAREAVLFTVIDYYKAKFSRVPQEKSLRYFAYIISWNLWQMDGLKLVLPYSCRDEIIPQQPDLFAQSDSEPAPLKKECSSCSKGIMSGHNGIKCKVRDWTAKKDAQVIDFEKLIKLN